MYCFYLFGFPFFIFRIINYLIKGLKLFLYPVFLNIFSSFSFKYILDESVIYKEEIVDFLAYVNDKIFEFIISRWRHL